MKNFIFLSSLFFTLFVRQGFAQQPGIRFEKGNWKAALAQSGHQHQLIFLEVSTSWCVPCRLMASEVFSQKVTGDFFNLHFINYAIDAEKGEGRIIAGQYPIEYYPTYLFINSHGKLIFKDHGFCNGDQLISMGEKAISIWKLSDQTDVGNKK